jgi:hypothetical protein
LISDPGADGSCGADARVAGTARSAAVRLLRILALLAYSLVFAEAFIRVFSPRPLLPRYVTGTPWGIRGNIPHAHYWHHTPEVRVQYRINGEGMRADREYSFQKPAGTCRIAVFGDSFLVGYELDLKDTFTTQLEQRLRTRAVNAEVLNFSVSGFGTAEMLRDYEQFGRKFDPDLVLFEWHSTDPDDNVRSGLYRLKNGILEPDRRKYLPGIQLQDFLMKSRLYRLIADNSQLYALIRERAAGSVKRWLVTQRRSSHRGGAEAAPQEQAASDEESSPAARWSSRDIQLSAALMAHARDLVTAEHRDFYVVEIPTRVTRTQFRSTVEMLPPETRAWMKVISPLSAFKRAARPDLKLYYEEGHGHLSPTGARILADEGLKAIEGSPQLARCTTTPASAAGTAAERHGPGTT